jgi:hypothetical protein
MTEQPKLTAISAVVNNAVSACIIAALSVHIQQQ